MLIALSASACVGMDDKSEAFRQTTTFVLDQIHRRDGSGLCEQGIDFFLCGGLGQVSYINSEYPFYYFLLRHGRK